MQAHVEELAIEARPKTVITTPITTIMGRLDQLPSQKHDVGILPYYFESKLQQIVLEKSGHHPHRLYVSAEYPIHFQPDWASPPWDRAQEFRQFIKVVMEGFSLKNNGPSQN